VALVLLVALALLNPRLAIYILAGLVISWAIANWRDALVLLGCLGILAFGAASAFFLYVLLSAGFFPGSGPDTYSYRAHYVSEATYREERLRFRERYVVSPEAATRIALYLRGFPDGGPDAPELPAAEIRRVVGDAMTRSGWGFEETDDGAFVFERSDRVVEADTGWWPPRTEIEVETPTIDLDEDGRVRAGDDSVLRLVGPERLLASSDPPAGEPVTSDGESRWTIVLDPKGGFRIEKAVLTLNGRLARFEAVEKALALSVSGIANWLALLVAFTLRDEIKAIVKSVVRRILRRGDPPPAAESPGDAG
jgi:hypothetical protein